MDLFAWENQTYTDPVTLEQLDPLEAFRHKLQRSMVPNLGDVRIEIDFNTVREKVGTSSQDLVHFEDMEDIRIDFYHQPVSRQLPKS